MVRVRFAPSPTGELHVGSARTALFNFLFAKQSSGVFVLRIEDTDIERSKREFEEAILRDLRWLGLEWDEGPLKGGPKGPYHQSERLSLYQEYAARLQVEGKIYSCYCTEEELEQERSITLARGRMPKYSGKCRRLTQKQKIELERSGRKAALRFTVEEGDAISFDDSVRGKITFERENLGDFVIFRAEGIPTYNFAVVIDDALMEISHIIRGEDHISNTPRQILVALALGFVSPHFAHIPLILGTDRSRLSKRHGAVSIDEYRKQGFMSDSLFNYLSLLGWNPGDGREIMSREEIIKSFSLERVSKSNAVFDMEKLKWRNSLAIRHFSGSELVELAAPFFQEQGIPILERKREWLSFLMDSLKGDVKVLSEIPAAASDFLKEEIVLEPEGLSVLKNEESRKVVQSFQELLLACPEELDADVFLKVKQELSQKTGKTGKGLLHPLRAALTGKLSGHELPIVITLLGKEKCLKRMECMLESSNK